MAVYTLFNANTRKQETVTLGSDAEAFAMAQDRNRKDRSQPWRAYDEHGYRIFGLFQDNEGGHIERIGRA